MKVIFPVTDVEEQIKVPIYPEGWTPEDGRDVIQYAYIDLDLDQETLDQILVDYYTYQGNPVGAGTGPDPFRGLGPLMGREGYKKLKDFFAGDSATKGPMGQPYTDGTKWVPRRKYGTYGGYAGIFGYSMELGIIDNG